MRDSGDVEAESVRLVDLDQGRPALRPFRKPLEKRAVSGGIGGNRDQSRIERARIGQPRSGLRPALRGRFGGGMDDGAVRALDGQDDRRVRR